MDFKLIKDKSELEGTCYFEFLPGKFKDEHWNNTSVFLSDDSMFVVEDLFEKNFIKYDHCGFCEIDSCDFLPLLKQLEERKLLILKEGKIKENSKLAIHEYYKEVNVAIQSNKEKVSFMIEELIDWIKLALKEQDTISILGL